MCLLLFQLVGVTHHWWDVSLNGQVGWSGLWFNWCFTVYFSYAWLVSLNIPLYGHYLQLRINFHISIWAFDKNQFVCFYTSQYHGYPIKCNTKFLKEVCTPIIFKCCLFFSLIICSHFVGSHLLCVELVELTFGKFSAKLSLSKKSDGKNSVRRKFRWGEFIRRNFPAPCEPLVLDHIT